MVRVDITEGGKVDSPVIGRKGTAEVHWRSSRHGDEDTEVYLRRRPISVLWRSMFRIGLISVWR